MFPVRGEVYKSINTGRMTYIIGIKCNKPSKYKNRISFKYDVCLVDAETHIYSEIPLAWFQSIYRRTAETFSPDDISIDFTTSRYTGNADLPDKNDDYRNYI